MPCEPISQGFYIKKHRKTQSLHIINVMQQYYTFIPLAGGWLAGWLAGRRGELRSENKQTPYNTRIRGGGNGGGDFPPAIYTERR